MTLSRIPWTPAFLAAALTLGCGGANTTEVGVAPERAPAGQEDMAAIVKAKADSARYPHTEADVHFMSAMIGHHAQAIVIAGWAPSHEADAAVRRLAERIINAQQDEIATMERWLRDRGQPMPDASATGMKVSGHQHPSTSSGMLMPGMLNEAQMQQLDQSRVQEFDRLFLTFMIQHHRGAVTMVKDLFGSRGAAQEETVFKFANDVSVDQSTEIERMEKMLAGFGSAAGAP